MNPREETRAAQRVQSLVRDSAAELTATLLVKDTTRNLEPTVPGQSKHPYNPLEAHVVQAFIASGARGGRATDRNKRPHEPRRVQDHGP